MQNITVICLLPVSPDLHPQFFIYFMIKNSYMKYWMNMEISRNGYGISRFYNDVEGFIELF